MNICLDAKGKKTVTEAKCEELGLKPGTVIVDIKPKAKKCYDMEETIKYQRAQAAKIRSNRAAISMNETAATIIDGQADLTELRYKRECER